MNFTKVSLALLAGTASAYNLNNGTTGNTTGSDATGNPIAATGSTGSGGTSMQACTTQFVDCSNRGGYDSSDPCNHTCNDDNVTGSGISGFPVGSGVNPATGTGTTTGSGIIGTNGTGASGWPVGSGVNPATGTSSILSGIIGTNGTGASGQPTGSGVIPTASGAVYTGRISTNPMDFIFNNIIGSNGSGGSGACTRQFVDCSNRGGYDLSDPCRHTCNDDDDASDVNRPGGCCQLTETDNFCAWFEYEYGRCKKLSRRNIGCNRGHWNPRAIYNSETYRCEEPEAPEVGCCQVSATDNHCAHNEYPSGQCDKITVAGDISCNSGFWNPNASLVGSICVPSMLP